MKFSLKIASLVICVYMSNNNCQAKQAAALKADTMMLNKNMTIGKPLPDLTLQTPDGSIIKLSSLKGAVVLIDLWASWCMPCRASIPHLKELYQKYHAKGFQIVSISIDQSSKAWKTAMLKEAMPWQQAIDTYAAGKDTSEIMTSLGISSVPFAIIIDAQGKVKLINPGGGEIDSELMKIFKL